MPYARGRTRHDADSHIFETPDFYLPFASRSVQGRMKADVVDGLFSREFFEESIEDLNDAAFLAAAADEIATRKLWQAMGAFKRGDRSIALDLLGYSSQLVFNSFMRFQLHAAERGHDMDYLYGLGETHNRAMMDFCSSDHRLLPVAYVPLAETPRTIAFANSVLESGFPAIEVSADCPATHSPSHVELEPLWSMMAEARVPVIYHLGSGRMLDPSFLENGREPEPSFRGGDGQVTSIEHVACPHPVMESLAVLIFDGVLARHPDLRVGLAEFSASWVPGWMRLIDSAYVAFKKREKRLKDLELLPSEYVKRQVRITAFPHEDVGWVISHSSSDMFMFASDFPHIEGGRNPARGLEQSLHAHDLGQAAMDKFWKENFADFMGGRVMAS